TDRYSQRYLADRVEIDDLLTRYAMAIDDGDWDALDSVFTPEATIDYTSAGGIRGSFPEVKPWLEKALAPFPVRQHVIANQRAVIQGDRATVRAYFLHHMRLTVADGS